MKKLSTLVLSSLLISFASTVFASDSIKDPNLPKQNDEGRKAAIVLNHLHGSLNKIVTYNDKIILEQEYDKIINNLDLTIIEDREIIDQISYIMDVLTSHKISETEKQMLHTEYQEKLDDSLTDTLRGFRVTGNDPVTMGFSLLTSMGGAYMDYQNNQKQYKKDLDKSNWELDKASISEINDLRKQFIRTYWEIMKRYDMPDAWRISESQFERFHDILKNDKGAVKYRKLKRLEEELAVLPDYWFELALSAKEINDSKAELEAINRYEKLNDNLLRENSFHSLLLANKMHHLDLTTEADTVRDLLKQMLSVDRLNPDRKLVAALKYLQLGDHSKAEKLFNENIDDGFLVDLNARFKIDMYLSQNSEDKYAATINSLITKQNISASEYLFYLGERPLPALLDEVKEQIEGIAFTIDSETFGDDNIEVTLSKRWVFEDIENTTINLVVDGTTFETSELSKTDNTLVYTFDESFNRDEVIENGQKDISLSMVVQKLPITIKYSIHRANIEQVEQAEAKNSSAEDDKENKEDEGMLGSISSFTSNSFNSAKKSTTAAYGNMKNYVTEEFVFEPISITANGKCFEVTHTLRECQ